MSKKAIQITETTKNALVRQFNMEDDELDDSLGMYLITSFGAETVWEGIVSRDILTETFRKVGNLKGEWIEVEEK